MITANKNSSLKMVTVIIPFYKNKEWLDEALETVANQTYKNLDVIIINDGSAEEITHLEKKYEDFRFITTENKGAGAARNLGIELATGDFISFLDSDDLWEFTKIEKQLQFMILKKVMWSHTNYQIFHDDDLLATKMINTRLSGNIIPKMFITCPIATPCVMIKTDVLKNNPEIRFASQFRAGEDSFLWFKLAEKYELDWMNESLTKVRIRGKNASRNAFLQLESKAQNFSFIKNSKNLFKNNLHYNLVLFGFFLSKFFYNVICFMSKITAFKKYESTIAILFYIIPYIYLKIINKIFNL